jgi:hypothetical protein
MLEGDKPRRLLAHAGGIVALALLQRSTKEG